MMTSQSPVNVGNGTVLSMNDIDLDDSNLFNTSVDSNITDRRLVEVLAHLMSNNNQEPTVETDNLQEDPVGACDKKM